MRKAFVTTTILGLSEACTPSTAVEIPNAKISSAEQNAEQKAKADEPTDFPSEGETLDSEESPAKDMAPSKGGAQDNSMSETPKPDIVPTPTPMDGSTTPNKPDPSPAPKDEGPVAEGRYLIKSVHSGRCLDIPNASKDNGGGLEIYDCANDPSPPQVFQLIYHGDKLYEIKNLASGKSLEVRGQVMAPEKLIQQSTYVGGKWQQFSFLVQEDGTYLIKCNGANFVFDVQGAKTANKTPIQIWAPNNFVNERFTLTPVP